jgi:hypothetical protein
MFRPRAPLQPQTYAHEADDLEDASNPYLAPETPPRFGRAHFAPRQSFMPQPGLAHEFIGPESSSSPTLLAPSVSAQRQTTLPFKSTFRPPPFRPQASSKPSFGTFKPNASTTNAFRPPPFSQPQRATFQQPASEEEEADMWRELDERDDGGLYEELARAESESELSPEHLFHSDELSKAHQANLSLLLTS